VGRAVRHSLPSDAARRRPSYINAIPGLAKNTTLREQVELLAHKALEFCDPFVWRHATMLRLLR
jgi:hypothetical protein